MSEATAFPENSPCDRGRMPAAPSYAGSFYDRRGRPHYRPDEEEMTSATSYQSRAEDDRDNDGGIIDDHAIVFYPPLARRVHSRGISTLGRAGSLESSGGISTSRCSHQPRAGRSR